MRKFLPLIFLTLIITTVVTASSSITVNYAMEARTLVLNGVHSKGENAQVTALLSKAGTDLNSPNLGIEQIYGIDQVTAGKNGGYVVRMGLRIMDEDVELRVGGTDVDNATMISTHITTTPISVQDITDNAIKVGNDVYDLDSIYLNDDSIATSLKNGGNKIAVIIGGYWYDLLDSRADSSEFLKPIYALTPEEIEKWQLDTWYTNGSATPIKFTN